VPFTRLLIILVGKSPFKYYSIKDLLPVQAFLTQKRLHSVMKPLLSACGVPHKELLIVLKILPTLGPIRRMTAITTTATRTRMIAYSTSPCPLSFGWNNMDKFLSE
jgi:hypothetical protein